MHKYSGPWIVVSMSMSMSCTAGCPCICMMHHIHMESLSCPNQGLLPLSCTVFMVLFVSSLISPSMIAWKKPLLLIISHINNAVQKPDIPSSFLGNLENWPLLSQNAFLIPGAFSISTKKGYAGILKDDLVGISLL